MRVAIYGAGALGAYYGARFVLAGHEVHFIARGDHLKAMVENGLQIRSVEGDFRIDQPNATDDPANIGVVDLVMVGVKTWHVASITTPMKTLVGEQTTVLPFLNGVESADEIGSVIGMSAMIGGLSKVFCLIEAPGVIRHFTPGAFVSIGELDGGGSQRTQYIAQHFIDAGVEAEVSEDIRTDLWKKLLLVSSWSGIGAAARQPIAVIRNQPETRDLIDRAMDEGIAVGRAHGFNVSADDKAGLWAFYDSLPDATTSSMYRDILAGRPSELHAWNGAVVRFGKAKGVPTPIHDTIYNTLLIAERNARGEL